MSLSRVVRVTLGASLAVPAALGLVAAAPVVSHAAGDVVSQASVKWNKPQPSVKWNTPQASVKWNSPQPSAQG